MANFNKVILAGNLTRDPELRYTPKGTAIANITLAINRTWKSETGEMKEEVSFVDVDVWGRQAEVIAQYMKKGRPLLVEGRLKQDTWEDKNTNQKQSKLKVVLESFSFIDSDSGVNFGGTSAMVSLSILPLKSARDNRHHRRACRYPTPICEGFIPGKGERYSAIHHVRRDDFGIYPLPPVPERPSPLILLKARVEKGNPSYLKS